ncbi:hypothetical protein PVAP13_7KG064416 [Panicum virgatum]|uniref:Uncharacterized protein n=1 Tax=Panicum virgatum TaxID=38727 RepID=A0A8T0QJX2_PANVG|nr:hypothetical protein PVAP13_7KG064416 [Panicum virgatum]
MIGSLKFQFMFMKKKNPFKYSQYFRTWLHTSEYVLFRVQSAGPDKMQGSSTVPRIEGIFAAGVQCSPLSDRIPLTIFAEILM